MKKQIFILVFVLFALGITNSYGQLAPRAISAVCLPNDALHPIPGTSYAYTINVPNPAGGTAWDTKKYTWFVTQETNFLRIDPTTKLPILKYSTSTDDKAESATTSLLMVPTAATDVTNYAAPTNTTATTINLTWKSFAYNPAKPVFVVVNVAGTAATGCTDLSNLKVYEIAPVFAFTLDIENLNENGTLPSPLAYGANINNCISAIQGASFDVTAGVRSISYDYGADTLYYEVSAANWFDRWELSVKITGLDATNQTAQLDWAYAPTTRPIVYKTALPAASWNVIVASASNTTPYASSTLVAPKTVGAKSVDKNGESIIIRMIVDHGSKYEGITDEPLTLAVDGILYHDTTTPGTYNVKGTALESDINTVAGTVPAMPCPWYDGFANDIATQTIKARPNITSTTVGVAPNPNPGNFLPIK